MGNCRVLKLANSTLLAVSLIGLMGCRHTLCHDERQLKEKLYSVNSFYKPITDKTGQLTPLAASNFLEDYLKFSISNQPKVRAAYFNWLASLEDIELARSLPDPQLGFQADIHKVLTSFMTGLMMAFPGPTKLRTQAERASKASWERYYQFEMAVLQAILDFKKAYFPLYFLQKKLVLKRQQLDLLQRIKVLFRAQNDLGKASLLTLLDLQMEEDQLKTQIQSLEDQKKPLEAQWNASMGLLPKQHTLPLPDPQAETNFFSELDPSRYLEEAFFHNPRLQALEATVKQADSTFQLAKKESIPNFKAGFEVDLKMSPVLYRPSFGLTLPLWRKKVLAQIKKAQAEKNAAEARLSSEEITLSVELAEKLFLYRETQRQLDLLQRQLLPSVQKKWDLLYVDYLAGEGTLFQLLRQQMAIFELQFNAVEAQTRLKILTAELSVLILGVKDNFFLFQEERNPSPLKRLNTAKVSESKSAHSNLTRSYL